MPLFQPVPLSVALGGTGAATLTGILKGAGTGAFTALTDPLPKANGGTGTTGQSTWTPALAFGGATTGITYSAASQNGKYQQLGDVLVGSFQFILTSKGSATGAATVTGFPITTPASLNGGVYCYYYTGMSLVTQINGYVNTGATPNFVLQTSPAAGSAISNLTDTNFTNTSTLICSFIVSMV